ncbi:YmfQ family protein [Thalassospira alkalitolerans]|uniref:YmfQ family protein n=1 Tax=Thalassospira alkalitolerans TaxID=1293890 RepID=UPI0030EF43F7|tara:strand:+ start:22205 stop:22789 length:585 start_codon:yes stop_codon:yes gene_type:complete
MRATIDQYLRQLQSLMPRGSAWARDADASLTRLLRAFAAPLSRVHNRALDLIEEIDPRTSVELLSDWERVCGLPDPCSGQPESLAERRDQVVAKLAARGGQSKAFFIELAKNLGYEVTITEFRPFTCVSNCNDSLTQGDWRFAWQVNAPEETIRDFVAISACNEPLRTWGNEPLECNITRLKPAHTRVIFTYGA